MKYILLFTLGILTGLSFSRIPHYPLFNDLPPTVDGWEPKMVGSWSDEDRQMLSRYFNGGKGLTND